MKNVKRKNKRGRGETGRVKKRGKKRTRPDTRLPKSRVGEQGPYLKLLDHLGKSSGVKKK